MDEALKKRIEQDIQDNRIMLYMKGTPEMAMCGFSGQVVAVLNSHGVEFASCNVLEDEEVRQGIKEYSDWPTVPQLYVEGEFVGGCDIVVEMHQAGDLAGLLKESAS